MILTADQFDALENAGVKSAVSYILSVFAREVEGCERMEWAPLHDEAPEAARASAHALRAVTFVLPYTCTAAAVVEALIDAAWKGASLLEGDRELRKAAARDASFAAQFNREARAQFAQYERDNPARTGADGDCEGD